MYLRLLPSLPKIGLAFFICLLPAILKAQTNIPQLSVHVIDAKQHEAIMGAFVVVGGRWHTTNAQGTCLLPQHLAQYTDTISIGMIGYHTFRTTYGHLVQIGHLEVALSPLEATLGTAQVHGVRQPQAVEVHDRIDQNTLTQNLGRSLAATLEQVKGVSMVRSGATLGKPVIQGMYGNRILIINNGIRQRGQQWGNDHAPELDMHSAGSIEVVKGAASVRYGSEALAGVIVLQERPLPYDSTHLHGNISALYATNGRGISTTGYVEGSLPFAPHWAWRTQSTIIRAGDRATPHYLLNNTGIREYDFSAALGRRKGPLTLELLGSRYFTKAGTLYIAQLGDVDLLKERISLGQPMETQPFSSLIDVPNQQVVHTLIKAKAIYKTPEMGKLQAQLSFQHDARDEFHNRRNNLSHVPALSLRLASWQTDLSWEHHYAKTWQTQAGMHMGYDKNKNTPGTGVVPIIPNYTDLNAAAFAIQRWGKSLWKAEVGIRYDFQLSDARGINIYGELYGNKRSFSNLTYNAAIRYHLLPKLQIMSNVGVAWRAPHVHELYSNGADHASGLYLRGDSTLTSERSTKWITSLQWQHKNVTIDVEAYLQWVGHYIYDEPIHQFFTVVSGSYPVFAYRQTDAFFRGIDADFSWHITRGLKYTAQAAMVWANERSTKRYLPYIPPFKLTQHLAYTWDTKGLWHGLLFEINHQYVTKQTRFDPETDLVNFTPNAYHLLGAKAAANLHLGYGQRLRFTLETDNLLNHAYKDYTNRFRYYAHEVGRDIRLGITWQF